MIFSSEPLRRILDGMVHPSAAGDAHLARRHASFIAGHVAAGLLALLVLTGLLAVSGPPPLTIALAFLFLALPLPIAAFLSRTGNLPASFLLSAAALAGFLAYLAAFTGGMASPALVWLAIVPAESALAASRRVTFLASLLAAAALALVALLDLAGVAMGAPPPQLGFIILAGAVLYAALLALRIQRIYARAEAAARDGEGRYRLLADNATDLITRHGLTGEVEFASPAARAVAGCLPAELLGTGFFERVHVADRPAFLQALSEADRTGRSLSVEFRLRRGDVGVPAEFAWLEMRCRPAVDPSDACRSIVAVSRDITVRKEYEAAFEDARVETEQVNRAKGQFLANMSHELRTPLNAIIGFSDMLRQELAGRLDQERHREYARLIHTAGEHLLEVVNGVLDMSKIEAGRFTLSAERFAVAQVIDASAEMLSQQFATRRLRLVRRIQPDMPEIFADRRACRQILLNLLSNSVKFTEPGGEVRVGARMEHGMLVLQVADDGIGISAADLPRLGTPFVQVEANYDRRYEGTGLGLSVVKGLVALHGGTLAIDSVLGRGTTVTIRLPAGNTVASLGDRRADRPDERERKIA